MAKIEASKSGKKPVRRPSRVLVRFHANPELQDELEALHQKTSPFHRSGGTIEKLVLAALAIVKDESPTPKIPAELVALRKSLGHPTTGSEFAPADDAALKTMLEQQEEILEGVRKLLSTQRKGL
jgi:hypothetical protein